ncbi:MAG: ATP-binding protein, partial [Paracoccaceae bacterium]
MTDFDLCAFLEALPLPTLSVDHDNRIEASNEAARALLGQQIDGRNFGTILRQPALQQAIENTLLDQESRSARYVASAGTQDVAYSVTCRSVGSSRTRNAERVIVCFEDASSLETADQMRRDFVANVSHELRTPLTALSGFIETLLGSARDDAPARERFLKIMADEASRMNRLIGDLLSLSRVEVQERVRPRDQLDLAALAASTIHSLTPLADEKGVSIEFECPEAPAFVMGDADQLRQVVTNLVENALKYGDAGKLVIVRITTVERDPALRTPCVRVEVIDRGMGIEPIHLPRLTERFYRADDHRSRQVGGTGLGLAIVKHVISRHRGRLQIKSDQGQGS